MVIVEGGAWTVLETFFQTIVVEVGKVLSVSVTPDALANSSPAIDPWTIFPSSSMLNGVGAERFFNGGSRSPSNPPNNPPSVVVVGEAEETGSGSALLAMGVDVGAGEADDDEESLAPRKKTESE